MFKDTPVLDSFAVKDLDEAQKFYSQTLGLKVTRNEMGILNLDLAGGAKAIIYPKEDFTPATYTILMFLVSDVEKAVTDLTAKGVKFEIYPEGQAATDERGITKGEGPKIAWFKDPAGNILSVLEDDRSTK